jgi:predicted Zn-dependent protease
MVAGFWLPPGHVARPSPIGLSEAFGFSVEKERELGEKVAHEIESRTHMVRVPSIQEYIDTVGKRLLSGADKSEFTIGFSVLKQSEPNAFAIPGGRIFLTSGLIRLAESEGELAGVMSHEIAHVVRRHIAQRIEASKRINIATLAGALAGILIGGSGGGAIMAGSLAMGESKMLKYTRDNESEADRLALAYLVRAGYGGRDMIRFFHKIYRTPQYNAVFPSYLSTHPGVSERISYLETLMKDLPRPTQSKRSADQLETVQLRLLIVDKEPLESLEYFNNLLGARPDDNEALFGRALAEKEMGRIKEAIEDLKRAHTLNPTEPEVLKELGLLFIRVGRFNEGVRALERSLFLWEKDAEALHYLGQGYQAQKALDRATQTYLKARALSPDLEGLNKDLGSVYREKGDMGRYHFYYGLYFKKRGQLEYARFHYEKARELLGRDAQRDEEIARELEWLRNRQPGSEL